MEYELAPMEGITGYVYRRAYHHHYRPLARYVTPFLSPKAGAPLSHREQSDVLPEHNEGMNVIPQILANRAETFLAAARELSGYGCREVNLNLGCPSGTVTAKGKGAGFLERPQELEYFLEEIAAGLAGLGMKLSIKTRLGMREPEEFERLLEIFNRFELTELVIHPRVREDYYGNTARLSWFCYGLEHSKNAVCYNGDIEGEVSLRRVLEAAAPDAGKPDAEESGAKELGFYRLMFGRGLLAAPWLVEELEGGLINEEAERARLADFHREIYEGYLAVMPGERPVLFKMKELWAFLIRPFPDSERYMKRIRKAKNCAEYEAAAAAVFRELRLDSDYCRTR